MYEYNLNDLQTVRHAFHSNPELGFQEVHTKASIAAHLHRLGIEVYQGTGVVGVLRSGTSNRIIGLRADMDALPISETSSHNYVSTTPGVMHACGHDGHMTMLLGAAQALATNPNFDGTVIFLFQPNEEKGLGARAMIEEGVLQQFPIQEIYAIHNLPGEPVGQVSTRTGLICSSESLFEISITGQGGHSSMPQVGSDVIISGCEIAQAMQTIVSRKLAPGAGVVVSLTEFLTDGKRNILPDAVTLKGDVRTRSPADRQLVEALIRKITCGISNAHDVSAEVQFNTEFIEAINAKLPTDAVIRVSKEAGLTTLADREPMSFSEDFAHFCIEVPGCFFLLGNGTTGPNAKPLHSKDYDFNDALLPIGLDLWVRIVQDRLPMPDL